MCTSLLDIHVLDIHVMINWHLSKQGIRWPVSRDHIVGSSWQLIKVKCCFEGDRWPDASFSIGLRAHVWLTCWKQGRVVREASECSPRIKRTPNYNFFFYANVFAAFFVYMVIIETQSKRPNNIQKTSAQSYKTQFKILLFPGLA